MLPDLSFTSSMWFSNSGSDRDAAVDRHRLPSDQRTGETEIDDEFRDIGRGADFLQRRAGERALATFLRPFDPPRAFNDPGRYRLDAHIGSERARQILRQVDDCRL